MIEILDNGIKWETKNQIAFREFYQEDKEEFYLIAKRQKEKHRVSLGMLHLGVLGSYSIKDILIGFGFRRVGIVGISKLCSAKIRIKCPYCRTIQELKEEWQQCLKCNKKFYLFDDNW